ncbi:MAG: SDR family NAD(P)-dependent oxidoreductase [Actinomycetota bacterium]
MKPLKDKVVLITGASRGLGVDMARAFAREGAKLALAARSGGGLERIRDELTAKGVTAIAAPADVGDYESLQALVKEVEAQLGGIDVLVNNAGIEDVFDFEAMTPERIEEIMHVNVVGLMWLTRLALPSMIARGSGHVSNIASIAGLTPVPHNAVYSASKHAIVGFSRSLRWELAEHGIEVSVVCPGFVDGGMFAEWGRPAPKASPAVSPEKVAEGVVRAVLDNKGEVVITRGLARIADVTFAMLPEFAGKMGGKSGAYGYLREQAKINADKKR